MSNSLTSKLSDLSVTAPAICNASDVFNGTSDVNANQLDLEKANPWKSRASQPSENKLLEADAWPEPSAPLERRSFNQKIEEKPKNKKLKWREIELEPPASTVPRGRGRFSSTSTVNSPAFQGSSNLPMRSRRGTGYGRPRIADVGRGCRPMNGFYQRQPERIYSRNADEKTNRHHVTYSNDSSFQEANKPLPTLDSKEVSPKNMGTSDEIGERSSANLSGYAGPHGNNLPMARGAATAEHDKLSIDSKSQIGPGTRRYTGSTTLDSMSGRPSRYTESYNRPRRPTARGHGYVYPNVPKGPNMSTQTMPIPAIAPVTYLVPGLMPGCIGNTLLSPGVALTPTTMTDRMNVIENSMHTMILPTPTVPLVAGDQNTLTAASVPLQSPVAVTVASTLTTDMSESPAMGSSSTEVVSLKDMLMYISEAGWNNTKIPECLKDDQAVIAAMEADMQQSGAVELTESKSEVVYEPTKPGETEKPTKREDVVIVDDSVFFVPRNVHHTKFLKFKSKLDYIRHHVDYYFSDANLKRDAHLVSILSENQMVCPLQSLLQFNRLRWANVTEADLLEAILASPTVTVIYSLENQPSGVTPNTVLSALRPSSAVSKGGGDGNGNVLDGKPTSSPETSVGTVYSAGQDESFKAIGSASASIVTPTSDVVAAVDTNNFFLETVVVPVFTGQPMPPSTYTSIPFVMQPQRMQVPPLGGQNQLNPAQQFFALQSSQGGYFMPSAYMYSSNLNQPQGISALQFSNHSAPYYMTATGATADPSSVATAQAVAAAVAAQQQQQTTSFPNSSVYAVSHSNVPANVNGTGPPENTTSPSLVPAFYRLNMPHPSTYGQYTTNQTGVGSNPVLLHFLPTIQSNLSNAFVPTGIPSSSPNSSTLAAMVGGSSRPQINNSGGLMIPLASVQNAAQQSPQVPYHGSSPITANVTGSFNQKVSTGLTRTLPNQINQRLVSSQYTQSPVTTNQATVSVPRPSDPGLIELVSKSSVDEMAVDTSA